MDVEEREESGLACFICKDVAFAPSYLACFRCACNPTALPACYKCLYDFVASRKLDGQIKCFTCDATASISTYANSSAVHIFPNTYLGKYMDRVAPHRLPLTCPYCASAIRRHADAHAHVRTCGAMPAACKSRGCAFKGTQADVRDHELVCPHGTKLCTYCSLRIPAHDLARHQSFGKCSGMPVPCPFCDQTPKTTDYVEHVQTHAADAEALAKEHADRLQMQQRIRQARPEEDGDAPLLPTRSSSFQSRLRRRLESTIQDSAHLRIPPHQDHHEYPNQEQEENNSSSNTNNTLYIYYTVDSTINDEMQ